MDQKTKIFERTPVPTLLLRFALPAIMALLVAELYSVVDVLFVGRFVGANAIGALTIAFPLQRLMLALAMMVAVGTLTQVARFSGERNREGIKEVMGNALTLSAMIFLFTATTIYLFRYPLLQLLGATPTLLPMTEDYVRIVIFGGVFQGLMYVMAYIMTALGNHKITLKATLFGALTNVLVDVLLVMHLGYGVRGAAIATLASQLLGFLYVAAHFKKAGHFDQLRWRMQADVVKYILAVGFATFIIEISDAVVSVFLNNQLSYQDGDTAIVAIGVITRVTMFLFIVLIGIANAMQTIASYNFGAANYRRVEAVLKYALGANTLITTLLWALMMIFARPFVQLFLQDAGLIRYTVTGLRIVISVFPLLATYYMTIYYYQVLEKPGESMMLSIYRQILIFLPVSYVLISQFGSLGAWMAFPVSDGISFLTSLLYLKRYYHLEEALEDAQAEALS